MQLTPLQSRLAASLLASCALILIYLTLFSPNFALAQEILSARPPLPDHDAAVLTLPAADGLSTHDSDGGADLRVRHTAVQYEPLFAAFGRSIIGRAPPGISALRNNVPEKSEIKPGTNKVFVFERASIQGREQQHMELRRDPLGGTQEEPSRLTDSGDVAPAASEAEEQANAAVQRRQQGTRTVYISANTCIQPQPIADATQMEPPQLTLYLSSTSPGSEGVKPGSVDDKGTWHVFTEGAVMVNVSSSEDVFVQVTAPTIKENAFSGVYNFEVAASVDASYHAYEDRPPGERSSPSSSSATDLVWVDSDDSNAVLTTRDLGTQPAGGGGGEQQQRPFVVFANQGNDRSISGVRYSLCGLQTYAQIAGIKDGRNSSLVRTSMSAGGSGSATRQQFHLSGLRAGTNYSTILAREARSNSPGGGGLVFRATNFATRQDQGSSCMLISSLQFCNKVAYSVPANRAKFNSTELANLYDNHVKGVYENFKKALAQIQCLTEPTSLYSLARNCQDCDDAYKDWVCAVSIPRCEEFSSTKPWLHARNINSPLPDGRNLTNDDLKGLTEKEREMAAYTESRNTFINKEIQPGPYKELLPCDYLCYDLTQSCHPKLQFQCPIPTSRHGYNHSYHPNVTTPEGEFMCNFPADSHFARAWSRAAGWPGCLDFGGVVYPCLSSEGTLHHWKQERLGFQVLMVRMGPACFFGVYKHECFTLHRNSLSGLNQGLDENGQMMQVTFDACL
ncbi:calcium influx-promoting protein ehs1 [Magnaporthiopsis poae ATCC 64411]|uniref:Calcium influx-promoting protein ehs1 n=1 Tax=Magnaporthiopsis poae (strain ATCC 64411 / 73-15) TaxID=644358 RepID=A0A0C4E5I3_MAGP6|nr:calcium influx-promoting protein ehs1 [Magnaporthiopsis poae ATCC 64411]